MRYPIQMNIIDPQSVLSDVDVHQVENMIWIRLAPNKRKIESVNFEISQLNHLQYGREHVVEMSTRLTSGKLIETCTTRVSKEAVLMSAVDHAKDQVARRIRFESSWIYRTATWTVRAFGSLFRPFRWLLRQWKTGQGNTRIQHRRKYKYQ